MTKIAKLLLIFAVMLSALNFSCSTTAARVERDPYGLFASGAELLEAGKYRASIRASEKAAEAFKDFSAYENGEAFYYDSLTQIGEAYLRMGKKARAARQFAEAFDLAPENADLLLGIAAVYFRMNEIAEGKAFFEAGIRRHAENPRAKAPLYYYYALCLAAEQNFETALYATQASRENYLRGGQEIPPEVEKFFHQVVESLSAAEAGEG